MTDTPRATPVDAEGTRVDLVAMKLAAAMIPGQVLESSVNVRTLRDLAQMAAAELTALRTSLVETQRDAEGKEWIIAQLRTALENYGRHHSWCECRKFEGLASINKCNCGFNAIGEIGHDVSAGVLADTPRATPVDAAPVDLETVARLAAEAESFDLEGYPVFPKDVAQMTRMRNVLAYLAIHSRSCVAEIRELRGKLEAQEIGIRNVVDYGARIERKRLEQEQVLTALRTSLAETQRDTREKERAAAEAGWLEGVNGEWNGANRMRAWIDASLPALPEPPRDDIGEIK